MYLKLTGLLFLALIFASCSGKTDNKKLVLADAQKLFKPLPTKMPGAENDTEAKIALGKKLYFDTNLSNDNNLSCNSCHMLNDGKAGVDNKATSEGIGGTFGERNSPTVFNAGFHLAQFWDGRAHDLKEQAGGPVLNPVEMGMPDINAVVKKLSAMPEYKEAFAKVFPDSKEINYDDITEAIAAYERTLITHDRFDDFLNGDLNALTNTEVNGLEVFMKKGCGSCHNGPLLGGLMYQKSGLVNPYKYQKDEGRYNVTKNEADKFFFKVPSLRNVALTYPYFHDGKIEILPEAIKEMGYIQLGQKLSEKEVQEIEIFLKSLTGKQFTKTN